MAYKILVVEDDSIIAGKICEHLSSFGYEARGAKDFADIMTQFAAFSPQLVIMDISLPYYNGYYWCSEIRKISKVPVIFISSADDNMNIVMAVNYGADDFVAKPFDLPVLMAKVRAVLRRTYDFGGTAGLLEHRGAVLNMDSASLIYRDIHVELTKNEYRILRILMENKGKTVKRDTIMTILWESDSFVDDNTLTVNVTRLRKKLEQAGLEDFITTKKGIGYIVE